MQDDILQKINNMFLYTFNYIKFNLNVTILDLRYFGFPIFLVRQMETTSLSILLLLYMKTIRIYSNHIMKKLNVFGNFDTNFTKQCINLRKKSE